MPAVPRNLLDLTILRPHPQPNESETVAVKAAICVLINTPEDSGSRPPPTGRAGPPVPVEEEGGVPFTLK